ncbi:MAG: GEVED domain-containing protein [Bacteroidota bacterium]
MENHYHNLSNLVVKTFISATFFLLGLQGFAQTQVNINKTGSRPDIEINLSEKANVPFFAQAKRARVFDLNSDIANPRGLQAGQKIRLQLLKDKDFQSTIVRKVTDVNGVTSVTVKLDDYNYAFGYITVSENSFLITIDIPENDEKYTTRKNPDNSDHYLLLLDKDKWDIINEGEPVLLDKNEHGNMDPILENNNIVPSTTEGSLMGTTESTTLSSTEAATLDIMIVYTPAARDWATTYNESIDNTVATAIASANTVSANSGLGINFNLVYSGLVDHVEEGAGNDLYSLRIDGDGKMDEVHNIRRNVEADLVAIFTLTSDVGGMAYLLYDKYGLPDAGFSLTRVQQASDSYTFVHELGHNMGAGHYKYQTTQPGRSYWSNWSENTWSSGWKWLSTDNTYYNDVMSYGPYEDGTQSNRTPYFSDPALIYAGGQAGDAVEGNASRTLRETKHIISQYSQRIQYCPALAQKIEMLFIERVALGQVDHHSNTTRFSDFSYQSANLIPQEKQTMTVDVTGYGAEKQVLVWIDWNDDSVFDPLTELVFTSNENADSYSIEITAPLGIISGPRRMRIRLHDVANGGNASPCGPSTYGEVEDYTITVDEIAPCDMAAVPGNLGASEVTDNELLLSWDPVPGITSYDIRYRKTEALEWNAINNILYPFQKILNLEASKSYEVQVRSICSGTPSVFSSSIITTTGTAASSISFLTPPTDTQAGRVIDTIKVELLDINGIRSSSTADVTLGLIDNQSAGAVLSGKNTVGARDGLAVFTDIKIDLDGTYTLKATASGLSSTESNTFTILPYVQTNLIVTNTANDGTGSLRAAIELANGTEESDLITFNLAGAGPYVISLLENLPPITQSLVLDATTQTGFTAGKPVVVIDGNKVPLTPNDSPDIPTGLFLTGNSAGSTIKGFIIGGFGNGDETEEQSGPYSTGTGIRSLTADNIIQGNWIGLSPDGITPNKNVWGIYLTNGNNIVGGPNVEDRNVVSGNWRYGIHLDMDSNNNQIEGNYIGTSVDGSQRIWNRYGLYAFTNENQITKNIISGNVTGLILSGSLNIISNNHIGTNPSGESAVPNNDGIWVLTRGQKIGVIDQGNLISGNKTYGIYFRNGAANNHLIANRIGTDITGSSSIPNMTGVFLNGSSTINNTIGGINSGEGNVISGNSAYGIEDGGGANQNWFYGNFIGTNKDGKIAIANGKGGIALFGSGGNLIGGVDAGKSNIIAFNVGWGIAVNGWSEKNLITGNQIYSNSSIGIDLGSNGITQNDRDDADYGPNRFQNYPELKNPADLQGGYLNLEYTVGSTSQYSAFPIKVEFFKSDGNRQGKEYLGYDLFNESDITKGKKGKMISLQLVPGTTLNGGGKILATATDALGNTSEFGAEVDVTGGCAETIYYADADEDGFGDPDNFQSSCTQPEGYVINSDDCNDTDPDIGNGLTWYADKDGDGFGDPGDTITACDQPEAFVDNADDCNDNDAFINPETIWYADKDGDGFGDPNNSLTVCNQPEGFLKNGDDCDDTNAEITAGTTWYADNDGDGHGDPTTGVTACEQPVGNVANNDDCDDTDPAVGTGAVWYADKDADGYGDPVDSKTACIQPAGYVSNNADCDDTDATVNPDTIWYADSDGDGFGDPKSTLTGCEQPAGYVINGDDCNDADASINPNTIWYVDVDGDGFGDLAVTITACEQPAGYVSNPDDCDDTDALVNPDATDICSDCDPGNDVGCEEECLGTDILYVSEVCTDGTTVNWVINNPGNCTVDVRWELRKKEDFGNLTVPPGDSYFSSKVASKGSTQITIYWNNSGGSETKTNANASGITCTSSSTIMGDETTEDTNTAVKVYPNPVNSEGIWLRFAERNKKAQFKVVAYDLSGRKMAETVLSVDTPGADILWEVDHSRWIEGIYILNISSGNEIYQIKIIK